MHHDSILFKSSSPSDQRTCKYCKHLVEDEIHFLFQCPQYSSIRSKFEIYEKVLVPTDILDEEMIKTINPVSPKDLKSICMYIQQALDICDHPAVNCSQWFSLYVYFQYRYVNDVL